MKGERIMIETKLYNSLISVMPNLDLNTMGIKKVIMCKNQPLSFQMAYKITDNSRRDISFFMKITSDLEISNYYVGYVPLIHTDYANLQPVVPIGMYPDILLPKKSNPKIVPKSAWSDIQYFEKDEKVKLTAYNDCCQSVWFTINENSKNLKGGIYKIKIELYSNQNVFMGSNELTVEVLDEKLPAQKLKYTNWFHHDCLVDKYKVQLFSEEYFKIMVNYLEKAVKNGMNMVLLPAFTPPLDTPVGEERMTVQLVKVKVDNGKYQFDFRLMKKYIDICKSVGIKYFEHSHFFTQWGARFAPKIVAEVDGKEKRIFGWDTKATGKKYVSFLRQYITELKKFLKEEKLEKKMLFHISDEPDESCIKEYSAARKIVAVLLDGYDIGDALSDVKFYDEGYCSTPIAATPFIHDFIGKCDNLWAYYIGWWTMGGTSNRLIQMPRERNRMLGIQLYYYNIKGFLQWAFNYYYGYMSQYFSNPVITPCGAFPGAGTSYMVYPSDDGDAYQSVRLKTFSEGLIDMRALVLLEKLAGRDICNKIIHKHFGEPRFNCSPDNPQDYTDFINELYQCIKNYSKKQ